MFNKYLKTDVKLGKVFNVLVVSSVDNMLLETR